METIEEGLEAKVPEHILPGLKRYVDHHIEPGGFLRAVLENDLKEAFGRADEDSRNGLFDIVCWLYNCAPGKCWGSPEKVQAWLREE